MDKPNKRASSTGQDRRENTLTPGPYEDQYTPEQRLAEHLASKVVPQTRFSVRQNLRGKMGNEAPLVRAMYDIANKPKRRSRRRKGRKS